MDEPFITVHQPGRLWTLSDGSFGHLEVQCDLAPAAPGYCAVHLQCRFRREPSKRPRWPKQIELCLYAVPYEAVQVVSTRPQTQNHNPLDAAWGFAVENTTSNWYTAEWIINYADRKDPKEKEWSGLCELDATFRVLNYPFVFEIKAFEVERLTKWRRMKRVRDLIEWQSLHVQVVRVGSEAQPHQPQVYQHRREEEKQEEVGEAESRVEDEVTGRKEEKNGTPEIQILLEI